MNSLHRSLPLLGCLADDVTGATDLALNLAQGGMRVEQWLTTPTVDEIQAIDADAVVIAAKIRSIPAEEATGIAAAVIRTLQSAGVERFYFKYCSTFDSTAAGNIGPVAETLLELLESEQSIFCPAFPQNGRTVYQGHLFVADALLQESGMERHPLNPMTDSRLTRVLARQSKRAVGLVGYADVTAGPETIRARLASSRGTFPLVICDACDEGHLQNLAEAVYDMPLITGGSGLARFLPEAYRRHGLLQETEESPALASVEGRTLILSGSCSAATNRQVEHAILDIPAYRIDVSDLMERPAEVRQQLRKYFDEQASQPTLMIYSTAPADKVAQWQQWYGADAVAQDVEALLAEVAVQAVGDLGIRRFILAGGETSGAVTNQLGVRRLRIGPEICPGVPWTETIDGKPLAIACKSGNFGGDDFFARALEMLP